MFSLICVWINGWVNNREAGDLRRYRAHYDVSVMKRNTFDDDDNDDEEKEDDAIFFSRGEKWVYHNFCMCTIYITRAWMLLLKLKVTKSQ